MEIDDDLLFAHGKHTWKIGAQSVGAFIHNYDPDTFNGAYVFGGGSAPVLATSSSPGGPTTTITGIEQYRRALLALPGGAPTTYQLTAGTPLVPLSQWKLALYAQDTIKLTPRLTASMGLRYAFQTAPTSLANVGPRFGLAWAPDKKETWVLHLRSGLFSEPVDSSYATQAARLDGVRQREALIYSPSFSSPLTPVAGSIQVSTVQRFPLRFLNYLRFRFKLVSSMSSPTIGTLKQTSRGWGLGHIPRKEHQCTVDRYERRRCTRSNSRVASSSSIYCEREHPAISKLRTSDG